jgi:hypothetical protein
MADCPRSSGVYVLIRVVMAPAGGHGMGPYDRRAPVRVEVHASEETVEIFVEADFETHAEERRRFAIMNIPRHLFSEATGQAAQRGAKKDRWTGAARMTTLGRRAPPGPIDIL